MAEAELAETESLEQQFAALTVEQRSQLWELLLAHGQQKALKVGAWGGAPTPVQGLALVLEPRYPFRLDNVDWPYEDEEEAASAETAGLQVLADAELVNSWTSLQTNEEIAIWRHRQLNKRFVTRRPLWAGRLDMTLNSLQAAVAYDLEAEQRACSKLASLISEHQYRCYITVGMFAASSKRSGLMYIFRKLRPTLALSMRGEHVRCLAGLCLHPIGYYQQTYAGVMVPTDDVIAHFLMMRGDEHRFWKHSTQHRVWDREVGL